MELEEALRILRKARIKYLGGDSLTSVTKYFFIKGKEGSKESIRVAIRSRDDAGSLLAIEGVMVSNTTMVGDEVLIRYRELSENDIAIKIILQKLKRSREIPSKYSSLLKIYKRVTKGGKY